MLRQLKETRERALEFFLNETVNKSFDVSNLLKILKTIKIPISTTTNNGILGQVTSVNEAFDNLREIAVLYTLIDGDILTKYGSDLKLNRVQRDLFRKVVLIINERLLLFKNQLETTEGSIDTTVITNSLDKL